MCIPRIATTGPALAPALTSKKYHSTVSLLLKSPCFYQIGFLGKQPVLLHRAFGFIFCRHCLEMLNTFTFELVFCKWSLMSQWSMREGRRAWWWGVHAWAQPQGDRAVCTPSSRPGHLMCSRTPRGQPGLDLSPDWWWWWWQQQQK